MGSNGPYFMEGDRILPRIGDSRVPCVVKDVRLPKHADESLVYICVATDNSFCLKGGVFAVWPGDDPILDETIQDPNS